MPYVRAAFVSVWSAMTPFGPRTVVANVVEDQRVAERWLRPLRRAVRIPSCRTSFRVLRTRDDLLDSHTRDRVARHSHVISFGFAQSLRRLLAVELSHSVLPFRFGGM